MPLLSFTPQSAEAHLLSHRFPSAPGSLCRNSDTLPCIPPAPEKPLCLLPNTIPIHPLPPHTHPRSPPGCQDATKAPLLGLAVPRKASPRWGRGRGSGPLPALLGGGSTQGPPGPASTRTWAAPPPARPPTRSEVFFKLEFVIPARGRWVVRAVFPFFPLFVCVFFSSPPLPHRNEPGPLRTPSTTPGHLRRGQLLFLLTLSITLSF